MDHQKHQNTKGLASQQFTISFQAIPLDQLSHEALWLFRALC